MAKSFRDLRARMSPEAQEAAEKKARAILAAMPISFVVSEHRERISVSMKRQEYGIQGQLTPHNRAGASGAAAGALTQMGGAYLGSIFSEIGDKRHYWPN